jgi:ribosomal protein S12 methylthiotransferase accessory factor
LEISSLFQPESSLYKNFTYGTHRLCAPAETFNRISQHFATVGITRIADVTGLDMIGIPVCNAVRPNAKSLSVSQGKGANLLLAKVSAAMEAIELYHAENISPDLTCSYRELTRTAHACDPDRLDPIRP